MGEDLPSDYADTEYRYNHFMTSALAEAIAALGLRAGWRVLDAGCGPGGVLPLLAAAVMPSGTVLGLDYSLAHVERARQLMQAHGLQNVVTVEVADLRVELPVAPHSCDAIWIADVLYPDTVGQPAAVVRRLARLLSPGGILAVFYGNWLRPVYLPGYARLEHLIGAAREARYASERPSQGQFHPECALAWLRGAGLQECRLQLFPVLHTQPLPQAVREYIATAIFAGHYAEAVAARDADAGLSPEDEALWRRLSDPTSPDCLLEQPDYYCAVSPILALGRRMA
jgi:arsenite methyltransferase